MCILEAHDAVADSRELLRKPWRVSGRDPGDVLTSYWTLVKIPPARPLTYKGPRVPIALLDFTTYTP